MTRIDRGMPQGGAEQKGRVLRARRLFSDLAGRVPDRARACRLEADLNDAWLCLQLAQVSDDPELVQARHRAYASLLSEALEAAEPRGRSAPRLSMI